MLQKATSYDVVEQALVGSGKIANPFNAATRNVQLLGFLKSNKTDSEMNQQIVTELESQKQFSSTDVNFNFRTLFE